MIANITMKYAELTVSVIPVFVDRAHILKSLSIQNFSESNTLKTTSSLTSIAVPPPLPNTLP